MSHIVMMSGGTKYDGDYLRGVTLPLPELTEAEKQHASLVQARDMLHVREAEGVVKTKAAERHARRTRQRIVAAIAGGFHLHGPSTRFETPAPEPTGLTRAERRRAKFGRL